MGLKKIKWHKSTEIKIINMKALKTKQLDECNTYSYNHKSLNIKIVSCLRLRIRLLNPKGWDYSKTKKCTGCDFKQLRDYNFKYLENMNNRLFLFFCHCNLVHSDQQW